MRLIVPGMAVRVLKPMCLEEFETKEGSLRVQTVGFDRRQGDLGIITEFIARKQIVRVQLGAPNWGVIAVRLADVQVLPVDGVQ